LILRKNSICATEKAYDKDQVSKRERRSAREEERKERKTKRTVY
jgi:hypothetical protein